MRHAPVQDHVVGLLRRGPLTVPQMAARSPYSRASVNHAVTALAAAGAITISGREAGLRRSEGPSRVWRLAEANAQPKGAAMAETLILLTVGCDRDMTRQTVASADAAEALARDYIRSHPSAATVRAGKVHFGHAGSQVILYRAAAEVQAIRVWKCTPDGWWIRDVQSQRTTDLFVVPVDSDPGSKPLKIHEPSPC